MTLSPFSPNQLVKSESSSSAGRMWKNQIHNETGNQSQFLHDASSIQWKSDTRLQIYSSKLYQALRHLRMNSRASGKPQTWLPKRVRDAANRALATTAKGRSRWSRAVFASSVKPKLLKKNSVVTQQRKLMRIVATGNSRSTKATAPPLKPKDLPAFQRKARLLSRLIPGCRKQPFHVTLEETMDYIPALEMQVRAMGALVELLSTRGSSSSSSSSMASVDAVVPSDSNLTSQD